MASKVLSEKKRRYNLHYKIRKQGYKLNTSQKTIYVHFDYKDFSKQVMFLINKYNYAIQYEM